MSDATITAEIQKMYVAFFNRPADPAGLQFWLDYVKAHDGLVSVVANAFGASQEYKTIYAGMDSAKIVDTIYFNLFSRHAEPDGLVFWTRAMDGGFLKLADIALTIANGAQGSDQVAVNSKVAAATLFTQELDTPAEIIGYSGNSANDIVRLWLSSVTDSATLQTATTPALLAEIITRATLASDPYVFTPAAASFNEGGSAILFIGVPASVPAGTVLQYTLSGTGITASDVEGGLSGTLTVSGRTETIRIPLLADQTTEGTETLTVSLSTVATATVPSIKVGEGSFSIADTSFTSQASLTAEIQKLYVAFFNRPADPAGLDFWVSVAQSNGGSTATIASAFSGAPEYKAIYSGMGSIEVIDTLYRNLFGRDAEPGGIAFWSSLLDSGALPLSTIATHIATGAQGTDKTAMAAKVSAATVFTSQVDTLTEIIDYSANRGTVMGKAWLAAVRDAETLEAATTQAVLDFVMKAPFSVPNRPDSLLLPDAVVHKEGETATLTLKTKGVADGTVFNFTLYGSRLEGGDVVGGFTGNVTVKDNSGTIAIQLANDNLTEGPEFMMVAVSSPASDGTAAALKALAMFVVRDTSQTPTRPAHESGGLDRVNGGDDVARDGSIHAPGADGLAELVGVGHGPHTGFAAWFA